MIKLDYTLTSPEDRRLLVEKIVAENPNLTPAYLEILADYLVLCMTKQEKKERQILTENRLTTVNKRETSFEGLVSKLENGEDGIYNLISENKHTIFQPKISITKNDIETIPFLKQLREAIEFWEKILKQSSGKQAFIIKKSLIEMRKEQYIIKQAYQRPINLNKVTRSNNHFIDLEDTSYMDEDGSLHIQGISLLEPKVVSAILCNYSKIKQDSYDQFKGDMWYLIQTFDDISGKALRHYPLYQRLVECKIDGMRNSDIQEILYKEFNIKHSLEYISSLWRNKIPKLIAQAAKEEFIIWYYKKNNLYMKKCSKCGQFKPAHNEFFSKNKTSKDNYYSICKHCRNKKKG